MLSKTDVFIVRGIAISVSLGVYLWFSGHREQGMFATMWVPALLCFGIYFKLLSEKK